MVKKTDYKIVLDLQSNPFLTSDAKEKATEAKTRSAKKKAKSKASGRSTKQITEGADVEAAPDAATIAAQEAASAAQLTLAKKPFDEKIKSAITVKSFKDELRATHVVGQMQLDNSTKWIAYIVDSSSSSSSPSSSPLQTVIAKVEVLVGPLHHVPQGLTTSFPPLINIPKEVDVGSKKHLAPEAYVQAKVTKHIVHNRSLHLLMRCIESIHSR